MVTLYRFSCALFTNCRPRRRPSPGTIFLPTGFNVLRLLWPAVDLHQAAPLGGRIRNATAAGRCTPPFAIRIYRLPARFPGDIRRPSSTIWTAKLRVDGAQRSALALCSPPLAPRQRFGSRRGILSSNGLGIAGHGRDPMHGARTSGCGGDGKGFLQALLILFYK